MFGFALLSCMVGVVLSQTPCVDVARDGWQARPPRYEVPMGTRLYYFVHHTEGEHCTDYVDCSQLVRDIQDEDIDENGYSDIGCHFLIGEDGRVYEGRGWETRGQHAGDWDGNAIGICFLGNYTDVIPNELGVDAAMFLIDCGVDRGYLPADYGLHGHTDAECSESCPGDALQGLVRVMANYNGCLTGGCMECPTSTPPPPS